MKEKLHPQYNQLTAECHCGAKYKSGSVLKDIRLDICSACHPMFSGKKDNLDSLMAKEERIVKFKQRTEATAKLKEEIKSREEKKKLSIKEELERKKRKQNKNILGKTEL